MASSGFSRADRVAEQIKRELAQLIRDRLKDPRVGMLSVLDVEVSKDMAHAKVWFDVLQADQAEDAEEVLNHAAGFLRHELGREMKLRITPQLRFFHDNTHTQGNVLSALIDKAVASDQKSDHSELSEDQ